MRAALPVLFLSGCCAFSGPTWRGPVSYPDAAGHLDFGEGREVP